MINIQANPDFRTTIVEIPMLSFDCCIVAYLSSTVQLMVADHRTFFGSLQGYAKVPGSAGSLGVLRTCIGQLPYDT